MMTLGVQYLICVVTVSLVFLIYLQQSTTIVDRAPSIYSDERDSYEIPPSLSTEDIVDYRRCSPSKPLRIFVHTIDHPLAMALADHPAATKNEAEACLFLTFLDGNNISLPSSWNSLAEPGINHVVVNINDNVSMTPMGSEFIVQANFDYGRFRPATDFSLSPNVAAFNKNTWQYRPSIMPLKRPNQFSLVVDSFDPVDSSGIPQVVCEQKCGSSLHTTSFCLLSSTPSFHLRLLESLRAGCIPVVMSTSQPMPFQDQLDWNLAMFRFPRSMTAWVPEILENIAKEVILEMRRRGRVFLARIDDAQALSKSLVAAIAERIHVPLQAFPEVPGKLIATGSYSTKNDTRIRSKFHAKKRNAHGPYLRARWNSGRDLSYTPNSVHDAPMMPADFYEGTKEHIDSINGTSLSLTRDEEQFTVLILAFNRDDGVRKLIENLRDCPHLNKIIVVWNNRERLPNGTWPEIHVPVEFVLSERNSLNSRFLPYDRIETESELSFGFRMWRENRDRLVGWVARWHHIFDNGTVKYGHRRASEQLEYSLILTGHAFVHKEFLYEYSFNQHPSILEYVDKYRNCEDIAMNYLVAHLSRRPPLKVFKKVDIKNGTSKSTKSSLSSRGSHYKERDECMQMLKALYGYNPLLFSQETAAPTGNFMKGL